MMVDLVKDVALECYLETVGEVIGISSFTSWEFKESRALLVGNILTSIYLAKVSKIIITQLLLVNPLIKRRRRELIRTNILNW